nr:uncharacterized protein LOC129454650 isoform X1 [Misgurnus anguillicaudatus]XP_055075180.1 uncharacterized protein LOC129454650 isoform X1 [Misgurnus anguillicaudatus]
MDIIVISLLTVLPCLCNAGSTDNVAFGANAVQSSTFDEFADANHAVDGNRESIYTRGSCSHTAGEYNPWWRVDLKRIYSINKVTITNRGDCCPERIEGAQIRIGNSLDNNGNNNKLAETVVSIPLGGTQTFTFDHILGQYVNIFLPGTQKILTLCEVEVYSDNIAFGADAVQSSTYDQFADAKHAVDGNRESIYTMGSCTHTEVEDNPWWRVDLKSIYSINRVIITNRGDCCEERIIGAQIRIGNSLDNNGNNNELASTIFTAPQHTATFEFKPILGRYVNIFLPGTQKILNFCEVEVYSDNIAFGANAVQSSTFDEFGDAKHAVDGNRESIYTRGSCSHTAGEYNPWWRVDLKRIYSINKVIITNRGDCCPERIDGAQIRIGNSLDNNGNNNELAAIVGSIPLGGTQTFTFDHIQGQYVNIFLPGNGNSKILTLCEVEVYPENIALGANAVQSSTFDQFADANHAVDGNRESIYTKGSCSHTAGEYNPWWRVDLKSIYSINRVTIINRGDCCEERIDGAQIRIGNSLDNNGNNNELAATIGSIPLGGTQTFTFDNIQGQYVNIFLPGNQKILTLCEVEVYAG